MKKIIAAQQSYAKTRGMTEECSLAEIADSALAINEAALREADEERHTRSRLALAFPADYRALETRLLPVPGTGLGLANEGEAIRLQGPDGAALDELAYVPAWHHPNLVETRGIALERISETGRSDDPNNWTSSVHPDGGTPGRPNTAGLPAVAPEHAPGLFIEPSPFSPDHDGFEDVAAIHYTLSEGGMLVRARIFDAWGRPVRTLAEALLATHTGTLVWDGLDDARRTLRIGIYVVLLEAVGTGSGTVERYKAPVVLARRLGG
jgi:hypothetical protein